MTTLTARKSIRIPMQALGLGVILAGAVLAASVAIIVANPAPETTQSVPATSSFAGGVPHQVAPLEGGDTAPMTTQGVPATSSFVSGVPHQVAPLEGGDTAPGFTGGVPHQVAPLEGGHE